ncbi:MAG: hypothetical protein HWE14_13355 [Flavobacteriia bacterium]|nr:hypothetical protein [Flavobacteriia bacterium]
MKLYSLRKQSKYLALHFIMVLSLNSCSGQSDKVVPRSEIMAVVYEDDSTYVEFLDRLVEELDVEQPISKDAFIDQLKEMSSSTFDHEHIWTWMEQEYPQFVGLGNELVFSDKVSMFSDYYRQNKASFSSEAQTTIEAFLKLIVKHQMMGFAAVESGKVASPEIDFSSLDDASAEICNRDYVQHLMKLCLYQWSTGPIQ